MAPRRKSTAVEPAEGRVDDVDVVDELEDAFLTYATTVIVARAIPDARDGLKPAQRRLLYAMWRAGLTPDKPYRKSVSAVSDTMKTYHPYGDSAIYDTLVRLAQPFTMRLTLVDGHGNFGGLDDSAAAARYTEARLTAAAVELLAETAEDTVDTRPNFDSTATEPIVLPAAWPALLVNGSSGIAVGMATSIPPHNLAEVVAAVQLRLANPGAGLDGLLAACPGPDFPSGGVIADTSGLRDVYATGRGTLRLRARMAVADDGRRPTLIVTELPYQVGPEKVVARIRDLVASGKLEGVDDIDDHSDRNNGLRLVITLDRGADVNAVAGELYRLTPLEETVSCNLVALVDGVPLTCTLTDLLDAFIGHRLEVLRRRSEFRRRKASDRLVVVDALLAAMDHLDEVIAIVRSTRSTDAARTKIAKLLKISTDAANAVLDLSLRRLGALERSKLSTERKELRTAVRDLDALLRSPKKLRDLLATELDAVAATHATPRRTSLGAGGLATADVTVSGRGLDLDADGSIGWGDGGVGAPACVVTADGRAVWIDTANVPTARRVDATQLGASNPVAVVDAAGVVAVVTSNGGVKRVALDPDRLRRAAASGRTVVRLADGDEVVAVFNCADTDELVMVSRKGRALRFAASEVRVTGESAGVMAGMRVTDDEVVAAGVVGDDQHIWLRTPKARKDTAVATTSVVVRKRGGGGVWALGRSGPVTVTGAGPRTA